MPPTHPSALRLAAALLLIGAPALAAPRQPAAETPPQPAKPNAPAPLPAQPELEQIVKDLESAGAKRDPIMPAAQPMARQPSPGAVRPGPNLLREGVFLTARRGRIGKSDRGEPMIIFDPDASGRMEPAMILLPTQNLAAAQRLVDRTDGAITLVVSGQVFAYHGRNFLLLTRPAEVVRAAAPVPTPTPKTPASAKNQAEQVMAELESGGAKPGALRLEAIRAEPGEERVASASIREGAFVASRRGRMVRSAAGGWTFVFDTDPESKGDQPLTLLPCVNLMAMEDLAQRAGESLSLTVSGQVFSQNGRPYLMPTMYVVQPRTAK